MKRAAQVISLFISCALLGCTVGKVRAPDHLTVTVSVTAPVGGDVIVIVDQTQANSSTSTASQAAEATPTVSVPLPGGLTSPYAVREW